MCRYIFFLLHNASAAYPENFSLYLGKKRIFVWCGYEYLHIFYHIEYEPLTALVKLPHYVIKKYDGSFL